MASKAKNDIWYPHYVSDYQKSTSELSILEHGAYRLLLDHYYMTSSPIPGDLEKVYRICRAFSQEERDAILMILRTYFFQNENGNYVNSRAEIEVAHRASVSGKRSKAAKNKHKKKSANAEQMQSKCRANAEQMHTQSQSQSQSHKTNTKSPCNPPPGWSMFWEVYPRKVNKAQAEKAYAKAVKKISPDALLAALNERLSMLAKNGSDYIPHPTTWLNGERWTDAIEKNNDAKPTGKNNPLPGTGW